jgi:hypothetical protein
MGNQNVLALPGITQEEFERTYLEVGKQAKKEVPWLNEDVIEARCIMMNLKTEKVVKFIEESEFVSLGCFCGATRALQSLGLKRFTYPFDWVRTNVPAVVRCLQRGFADFCTSSFVGCGPDANPGPGVRLCGGSQWGGSFWHHDPHNPKTQQDFARRIERFRGKLEVSPKVRRVFCLSLNALADLSDVPSLRALLEEMLPEAEVYMLVFIDNQSAPGFIHVAGDDQKTFFCLIHEGLFVDSGRTWSEQKHAEAYAAGIAQVLHIWSGNVIGYKIPQLPSYTALYAKCNNFDGGDPSKTMYWPQRIPNELRQYTNFHSKQPGSNLRCAKLDKDAIYMQQVVAAVQGAQLQTGKLDEKQQLQEMDEPSHPEVKLGSQTNPLAAQACYSAPVAWAPGFSPLSRCQSPLPGARARLPEYETPPPPLAVPSGSYASSGKLLHQMSFERASAGVVSLDASTRMVNAADQNSLKPATFDQGPARNKDASRASQSFAEAGVMEAITPKKAIPPAICPTPMRMQTAPVICPTPMRMHRTATAQAGRLGLHRSITPKPEQRMEMMPGRSITPKPGQRADSFHASSHASRLRSTTPKALRSSSSFQHLPVHLQGHPATTMDY